MTTLIFTLTWLNMIYLIGLTPIQGDKKRGHPEQGRWSKKLKHVLLIAFEQMIKQVKYNRLIQMSDWYDQYWLNYWHNL